MTVAVVEHGSMKGTGVIILTPQEVEELAELVKKTQEVCTSERQIQKSGRDERKGFLQSEKGPFYAISTFGYW